MDFSLIMPFDTDDPAFRRGVEVGMVWGLTGQGGPCSALVHTDVAEMALRVAESRNMSVRSEEIDDTWMHLDFTPGGI